MSKNDYRDIDRAQDRELMRLFEETAFAFEKGPNNSNQQQIRFDHAAPSVATAVEFNVDTHGGVDIKRGLTRIFCDTGLEYLHGAIPIVLNGFDLNLPSAHDGFTREVWDQMKNDRAG